MARAKHNYRSDIERVQTYDINAGFGMTYAGETHDVVSRKVTAPYQGENNHHHILEGQTSTVNGHAHNFTLVTGPAIAVDDGTHVHELNAVKSDMQEHSSRKQSYEGNSRMTGVAPDLVIYERPAQTENNPTFQPQERASRTDFTSWPVQNQTTTVAQRSNTANASAPGFSRASANYAHWVSQKQTPQLSGVQYHRPGDSYPL